MHARKASDILLGNKLRQADGALFAVLVRFAGPAKSLVFVGERVVLDHFLRRTPGAVFLDDPNEPVQAGQKTRAKPDAKVHLRCIVQHCLWLEVVMNVRVVYVLMVISPHRWIHGRVVRDPSRPVVEHAQILLIVVPGGR